MGCAEPDDVPFLFEFVRVWSSYTIKRLCVAFASLHRQRCCDADGVARKIYHENNRAWVTVQELEDELKENNMKWDLIGLGEVRRKEESFTTLQSGHLLYHSEANNGQAGVGFS